MKSDIQLIAYVVKQVNRHQKSYIPLQLIQIMFQFLLNMFFVFFPSYVLKLLQQDLSYQTLITRVIAVLFIYFIIWQVSTELQRRIQIKGARLRMSFGKDLAIATMGLRYDLVENPKYQTLKDEAAYPLQGRSSLDVLLELLPKIILAILNLTTMFVLIVRFNFLYLLIVFVITLMNIWFNRYYSKIEQKAVREDLRQNKEYNYYINLCNNPQIAKDVRVYGQQQYFTSKMNNLFKRLVKSGKEQYGAKDKREAMNRLINIVLMIVSYSYLLVLMLDGQLPIEDFILMVNASSTFTTQIYSIVDVYLSTSRELIYLASYKKYMDLCESTKYNGKIELENDITSVTFDNVHFTYPNSDNEVLKGLSFHIDAKTSTSIVGANGSGKTTMIKLLSRLYEPSSGQILINGIDIKDYEYSSYIKKLSIIFQDFKTFNMTLKENITLQQDFDDIKFREAIVDSQLDQELSKFPFDVDTIIGKRFESNGIEPSKGQEQKIAIARAIYKDASLMILDEPTASLDPQAEEEVYKHFRYITKNKLSIFISHRLSSCRFTDQILFLENGIISEHGSHDELIKLNKGYALMFDLQASKYRT